jgi:chemotaxis protein methyltransferase CheR
MSRAGARSREAMHYTRRAAMVPSESVPSAAAFAFIADVVHRHSRIRLGADKQALVAGRLARRLAAVGLGSYDAYCDLLRSSAGDAEIGVLIDLVTTNHTQFFREPAHFDVLAAEVLPELARTAGRAGRETRVWCAAAASGEEAYSLAIVHAEHERRCAGGPWQVHASDISRRMLERGRLAVYEADRVQLPDAAWLPRYFRRGFGEREGRYRVKPALRGRVVFERINLFQPAYPVPRGLDVIFCRNVMIYFDVESRQELTQRLFDQLAPGGSLFVGHAESLLGLQHGFDSVHPGVYRRPTTGARS